MLSRSARTGSCLRRWAASWARYGYGTLPPANPWAGHSMVTHSDQVQPRPWPSSPDGELLASAEIGSVQLWDPATGEPVGQPLTGHVRPVDSVTFSPDGKSSPPPKVTCSGWRRVGAIPRSARRTAAGLRRLTRRAAMGPGPSSPTSVGAITAWRHREGSGSVGVAVNSRPGLLACVLALSPRAVKLVKAAIT
jgi:hypothetical protein